ncbi:DUF5753 domain-containing protein [Streptomyces uncialis]|uniref:DUF5753 domain-containing protein n=1 Tax=Streptomyces uncialis TaxID=1048205 RepID=UPI00386AD92B|nr:DUF5753 domain-containing protein [Streptomyces uncialis]
MYELVRSEGFAAKFKRWTTCEPDALAISEWSPTVVPGLLQTPSYAREIFRVANPRAAADEIRALVRARMTRQELFRRACPPDFSTVLCESVIRRGVGGAPLMREQLSLLLSHGKRPTSVVQILPLDAGAHGLMGGTLSLLTRQSGATLAYTEGIRLGGIVEDPADVRALARSCDVLTASALPPEASAELILNVMEAL